MVLVQSVVHPRGLHPVMAVKAHYLHTEEGLSYAEICDEVHNMQGKRPSVKSVGSGVKRTAEVLTGKAGKLLPEIGYKKYGRTGLLTEVQKLQLLIFSNLEVDAVLRMCFPLQGAAVGRIPANHHQMLGRVRVQVEAGEQEAAPLRQAAEGP